MLASRGVHLASAGVADQPARSVARETRHSHGLLLAAHLDAAFDAGLVDFDDAGQIRFAERFSPADRLAAGLYDAMALAKLTPEHRTFLAWRRAIY